MVILMKRRFIDNGMVYKRVKSFGHEKAAVAYVEQITQEHKSRRFRPIIDRFTWTMFNNRVKITRFRVCVPVKES